MDSEIVAKRDRVDVDENVLVAKVAGKLVPNAACLVGTILTAIRNEDFRHFFPSRALGSKRCQHSTVRNVATSSIWRNGDAPRTSSLAIHLAHPNTVRMNSTDITAAQARKLHEALFPHVNYLLRLTRRLEDLRFPADDPLRVAVANAYDAVWRLSQEAHHLAIRMGCR